MCAYLLTDVVSNDTDSNKEENKIGSLSYNDLVKYKKVHLMCNVRLSSATGKHLGKKLTGHTN